MNALRRLLTNLAESGRTGALHVGGAPGGVIYLVAGRITHAESAACPGIGERLVTSGRLSAGAWQSANGAGRESGTVGRALVRAGHLGHHELACRVVAAITAATHALLQGSDEAPMRFVPGERHWFGVVAQVELGALGPQTAKRLAARPVPHRPRAVRRTRPRVTTTR
ncbi:DUF4388 domain-containing protein [Actinoplanes auranticolor]|uniref:PatA-like N-terminal domain-containing protein n=1 Tax=Actinoplanes auranticolor TaxID=47988 RepID=A0A919VNB3_9ACTN|nr:DUF4388 domain-containing protein [Actinoplanes auranticolor]GIM69912.1 hypothetical protein Aau02nite_38510 [Actinoplanes auranticolor]